MPSGIAVPHEYWSSTAAEAAAYGAWGADLVFGHVGGGGPKVKSQQVWPVPGGPRDLDAWTL